jgi:hypothetical protein
MIRNKYTATPKSAAYGTPEIALAIGKCVWSKYPNEFGGMNEGVIVLAGHDEGVIAYGSSVEKTFILIQQLYDKYGG